MNKVALSVLMALACGGAQAQREYATDSRQERRVEKCVDDRVGRDRVSRKEMRKIEEQCSRTSSRTQDDRRDRNLDSRERELAARERQMESRRLRTSPEGFGGRNIPGIPDTSGAP
jgi:hypothetical protein